MKRFGRGLLNVALIVAGIFSAAFGLKGFLLSSRFIDGGVTGVSMLLSDVLLGVDSALYSILTYAAASKTIDFLLHGIEEYTAITIISTRSDEIKNAIMNQLHRGVTVYKGTGGLGSSGLTESEREILYCVVTRLEIGSIRNAVTEIDPAAFITTHALSDVHGGLVKKPIFH